MNLLVIWITLIYFCNHGTYGTFHTNFVMKRVEPCSKDNATKFYCKVVTEQGKQYLDFDITLQKALDETVGSVINIHTSIDGNIFIPIFTIRENSFCKTMNTYLGEFWYSIERSAQVPVGVCPIHKRRYYAHHHFLDYTKIKLQTFPFGTLRILFNAVDNLSKTKNSLFCLFMEIENVEN